MDELLGDVIKMDSGIFKSLERCVEVEVFDVEHGKPGTGLGEDTVDEELDEFKGAGRCANITRVTYAIASYGDVHAVGVILLGPVLAYHLGVCDLLLAVWGDVMVVDDEEGVSAQYAPSWDICAVVEALIEPAKFLDIEVPGVLMLGVAA